MTVPQFERKHVLLGIGYGVVLMVWLTPEDNNVLIVSILGTGLAALMVWLGLLRGFGGKKIPLASWVILGLLVGFGAVWSTQFLMIFKNAWHSHAYPDFSTALIVEMSRRLIPWTVAGGLLGAAGLLWRASFSP